MRYQKLDLNLLIALDILLIEKSVTRAAAKLHITQSAMSGILARLREYFDDPLVIQIGRKLELSPLADSLLEPVHDIIIRIDSTIVTKPKFDPRTAKRHFSFVVSDYVVDVFLLEVLERLSSEAPNLTFDFQHPNSGSFEELESGDIDFLITPDHLASPNHPHADLFGDSFCVVADAGNVNVTNVITLDSYLEKGHVIFRNGKKGGASSFDGWFTSHYGDTRRIEIVAHTFELLPKLVLGTERIATIATRLAKRYETALPIKIVKAEFEMPPLREVIQWHRHREKDPGSAWVRERLSQLALTLPALP